MNTLIVFFTICFISLIGFIFIKAFNFLPKANNLSVLGYSYGLGVGLTAFQLYIYSRFGIAWDKTALIIPWLIFFVSVLLYKNPKFNFKIKIERFNKIELILLLFITITVLYTLLEALIRPLAVWDGWAIWLLKSKIFFIDGGIIPSVLDYVKSDYPLVVSLLGTFVYIILGQIDDTSVLLSFFAFYAFLGIAFFSEVKDRFGTTHALFFTFLFLTLQNLVRHGGRMEVGQADLALGYYIFLSVNLLFVYIKDSQYKNLILLNIFLGITALIKFEGLAFTFIAQLILIFFIIRRKNYKNLILGLLWLFPLVEWELFKRFNGPLVTYFEAHSLVFSLNKILLSLEGIFKELINLKSWNVFWITYIFALFFYFRKNVEIYILNLIILTQLSMYTILYFFTVGNSPESSIERLLVHIAPLAMLYIAIVFKQRSNSNRIFERLGLKK